MHLPAARLCAGIAGTALVLLTGCSSNSDSKIQTIAPATAQQSPSTSTAPAGQVRPSPAIRLMRFDPSTSLLGEITGSGNDLAIIDTRNIDAPPRTVHLDEPAVALADGVPGELLIAAGHGVTRVDLRSGRTTRIDAGGDAISAALLADGRIAVGLSNGSIRLVDPKTHESGTISGLASVDGLAVTGDHLAALDRRQTSITQIDLGSDSLGLSLRAGEGATNLATDHFGRILVTDTTGGELLVLTNDPLTMRQRFPVGTSPYGVAYDNRADVAWVTLTGTNEVVGYKLGTGMPKEVHRFPTVRQPDSVAVDPDTGNLFIGSAAGDGMQTIATLAPNGGR